MAERPAETRSVIPEVANTETWQAWGRRYNRRLRGMGKEPYKTAEGNLSPIPPDTPDSMFHDLATGEDTATFDNIVAELAPKGIQAVMEQCRAWGSVAVMQFFRSEQKG